MQRIGDYFGRHPAEIVTMDPRSSASCRRCDPRRSSPGFTLVELLVVITVIVLLLALLLPVLKNAREQAVRVTCMTNLKQRGIAYIAYATDSRSYLPHVVDDYNPSPTDRYDTFYPDGTTYPGPVMSLLLASYTNNNLAVWWCPELWKIRTEVTEDDVGPPNNWDTWNFDVQAQNSVSAGGFIKLVPMFSPPWDSENDAKDNTTPGHNAWIYRDSVNTSLRVDPATGQWIANTRTPVFLGTALIDPSPSLPPGTLTGGHVQTKPPRLSEPLARGAALTVVEMYPTINHIGEYSNGGAYRHQYTTGNEGSNVLRLDGSAKWYTVGSGADWHWYWREGGGKQSVIQPFE